MEHQSSYKIILQKYFGRAKPTLRIRFTNGSEVRGILIGYFYNEDKPEEPAITRWRFVHEKDISDYLNNPEKYLIEGQILLHSEIDHIEFG